MASSTGGGMFSPASPAAGSRLAAADVGSPADDTRSVGYAARQSLAKGPVNRCAEVQQGALHTLQNGMSVIICSVMHDALA
jgi:hypothetical protein